MRRICFRQFEIDFGFIELVLKHARVTAFRKGSCVIREQFETSGKILLGGNVVFLDRRATGALAELLEPSIDVTRPPISEADTEALVKLVVFEERRRKEGTGSNRPSVKPPPLPMGRAASSIPAAARVSVPPPLPGSKGNRSE